MNFISKLFPGATQAPTPPSISDAGFQIARAVSEAWKGIGFIRKMGSKGFD